ncbi:MAG: diguanylate cyclase [Pirellula sp.]|nr:diguanylate cyclase [Pirellula sp.]
MSWSRFITVENLCIAAEVTAALLLVAFALPEKRNKVTAPADDEGKRALLDLARRAFLEEKTAQCLARLATAGSSRPAVDTTERSVSELVDAESLGWLDRLSGTYNRTFFDLFLKRWLALSCESRQGSYLTMVSLQNYPDLVRDSGPVHVEMMLRDLGNRLKSQFSDRAIVARLPPDCFLILTFDADPTVGVKCTDLTSKTSSDPAAGEEADKNPLTLISSVVELSDDIPAAEGIVGELEQGIDTATQIGEKFVIKQGSQWLEKLPTRSLPSANAPVQIKAAPSTAKKNNSTSQAPDDSDGDSPSSSANKLVSSDTEENVTQSETPIDPIADENPDNSAASTSDSQPQGKPADVSAVASNEEIAALFAQIKKNENQSGESKQDSAVAVSSATSESTAVSDAVSSDNPVSEISETDNISADDIAALFAATKPASKPAATPITAPAVQPVATQSNRNADVEELDSLSETASADDIAALFKAVQEEKKPNGPDLAKPSAATNNRFAKEIEDLSESATTEDIAELFKSVQSGLASTKNSEQSAVAAPASPTTEDLDASATADDIAALFATVKRESKPVESSKKPNQKLVETEPKQEPEAPIDLQENASSDDIAALFAQMKKK